MPNGNGWRKGDRCLHRPSGQRGIVEDVRFPEDGEELLIYWGADRGQEFRDWVPEEDCTWELSPLVKAP